MAEITKEAGFEFEDFLKALQHAVSALQFRDGKLRVTMHEGSIVKVEFQPVLLVPVDRGGTPLLAEDQVGLNLRATHRFLARPFSRVLRDRIGPFGALKVLVRDGHVVEWEFRQRHRPRRAQRGLATVAGG
jgi:hypothetical protein